MARATPQEGTPAIQGNLHVPEDCRAVSGGPGAVGDKWMVPVSTPGGRRPFKTHVANLMRGGTPPNTRPSRGRQSLSDAYIAGAPEYEFARFSAEQHQEQSKIDCMKSK